MFKKTITFEDFNGKKITQDFYFHMSKADLLALAANGNVMMKRLQNIIEDKDGKGILKEFRELIEMSCGVRSEDGARFIKTPEAQSELLDSPAFDELLMELCTKTDASVEFVKQLIPEKMQREMEDQLKKQSASETSDPFPNPAENDPRPAWMREERNPTDVELMNMSREEMQLAFRQRRA